MRRYAAAALLALMIVSCVPIVAFAAPAGTLPVYDVLFAPDVGGRAGAIVTATLPDSVPLPAVVRLPLIPTSTITWSGEILGDLSSDIQREYKLSAGAGGQMVEIRAEKSRIVQYEADFGPAAGGGHVAALMKWVQSAESSETLMAVELPAGAQSPQFTPAAFGSPKLDGNGNSLYALEVPKLALGQTLEVSVSYVPKAASPQPLPNRVTGTGALLPTLLAILAVLVVALVVVVDRQRKTRIAAAREQRRARSAERTRAEP